MATNEADALVAAWCAALPYPAEDLVGKLWPAADLEARGLAADALSFDFGFESDNQDDFASLLVALLVAITLMLMFLTIQFRSIAQPVLVFLAVPFTFFGVFTLLEQREHGLGRLPHAFLAVLGRRCGKLPHLHLRRQNLSTAAAHRELRCCVGVARWKRSREPDGWSRRQCNLAATPAGMAAE